MEIQRKKEYPLVPLSGLAPGDAFEFSRALYLVTEAGAKWEYGPLVRVVCLSTGALHEWVGSVEVEPVYPVVSYASFGEEVTRRLS